jgi:hypothetical protein
MATVKYGDYTFTPSPNLTIQRDVFRTADNSRIIGGLYRVSLEGTRISGANDISGSGLWAYLNTDYRIFQATFQDCGTQILGRPLVESISRQSDDFWATKNTYNIELVFAASHISGVDDYIASGLNLENLSTSYNHSYIEKPFKFGNESSEPIIQVDRGISVKGLSVGSGNLDAPMNTGDLDATGLYKTAFQNAVDYTTGVLGASGNSITIPSMTQSILDVPADTEAFLTDRSVDANPEEGTIGVNDTFMLFPTGQASNRPTGYAASDFFDLSSEFATDNGVGTVNVNGTIQGYNSYHQNIGGARGGVLTPVVDKTAFEQASGYFNAALNDGIFGTRAETVFGGTLASNISGASTSVLNTGNPTSVSYSYNIKEGTINYSLTYNNSPANCVDGVLSEVISNTKNIGVPVIASHTVLGRAAGPILQDIGTKTANTWDLSIEAVIVPPTGCVAATSFTYTPNYGAVVSGIESGFGSNTYFKTADTESFDSKTGRYTRSVSWIYTECG